jgi:soluble lytic murein transglycosylase
MNVWRKVMIGTSWLALAVGAGAEPVPYAALQQGVVPMRGGLSALPVYGSESAKLHDGIEAAKSGDVSRASAIQAGLSDPLARRIVQWAMIDSAGSMLSFYDLETANRDMDGWPRASRRRAVAEKAMEAAAVSPQQVIDWFAGKDPETPEGAMALAAAYQSTSRGVEAQALIRRYWRDHVFEADQQSRMRARFGQFLTPDDDAQRLGTLLYGQQGPAARAMLDVVTPDVRALGQARIALRGDRNDAAQYVEAVPAALQSDPGLAFDRARYYRKRDLDTIAVGYLRNFPSTLPANSEVASFIWTERRALMNAALRSGDVRGAYAAVTGHGLLAGSDYADAEFFAGWIALTKLNDPVLADEHFAKIQSAVSSPISVSRAYYWRGRAAEAHGDTAAANGFWTQGAQYYTAFYGQLSAEKIGQRQLTLGADPVPTAADRARFEALDLVRAARMIEDAGEHDVFRAFVIAAAEELSSTEEFALLVDMARLYGDQDLSMRVVRVGAQKGSYLPERGYPILQTPQDYGAAEPAFMLAITRQESNFDPNARSGPGARGQMQLMPATASILARKLGVSYSPQLLQEPTYNLRLGGAYLGSLVNDFGGSYVMAAAGYNAGPGRPTQWTSYCGDPRGGARDPTDFIECIPFSETRNYVMRTMETTQIYRARLNGGVAPLTLAEDLKRGSWTPSVTPNLPSNTPTGGPIPYSQMSPSGGVSR